MADLFSPMTFMHGPAMKNRFMLAPLTNLQSHADGTLSDDETESVGLALMRLQETILDLARQFDIAPDELNLELGPVGKLL